MDSFAVDGYETSQTTGSSRKRVWPFGAEEEIYDPGSVISEIQHVNEAIDFESNENICLGSVTFYFSLLQAHWVAESCSDHQRKSTVIQPSYTWLALQSLAQRSGTAFRYRARRRLFCIGVRRKQVRTFD